MPMPALAPVESPDFWEVAVMALGEDGWELEDVAAASPRKVVED